MRIKVIDCNDCPCFRLVDWGISYQCGLSKIQSEYGIEPLFEDCPLKTKRYHIELKGDYREDYIEN